MFDLWKRAAKNSNFSHLEGIIIGLEKTILDPIKRVGSVAPEKELKKGICFFAVKKREVEIAMQNCRKKT